MSVLLERTLVDPSLLAVINSEKNDGGSGQRVTSVQPQTVSLPHKKWAP